MGTQTHATGMWEGSARAERAGAEGRRRRRRRWRRRRTRSAAAATAAAEPPAGWGRVGNRSLPGEGPRTWAADDARERGCGGLRYSAGGREARGAGGVGVRGLRCSLKKKKF